MAKIQRAKGAADKRDISNPPNDQIGTWDTIHPDEIRQMVLIKQRWEAELNNVNHEYRARRIGNDQLLEINAELLQALRVVMSHWPHWASQMDVKRIDLDAISMVRAAIAKAEGRAE